MEFNFFNLRNRESKNSISLKGKAFVNKNPKRVIMAIKVASNDIWSEFNKQQRARITLVIVV